MKFRNSTTRRAATYVFLGRETEREVKAKAHERTNIERERKGERDSSM